MENVNNRLQDMRDAPEDKKKALTDVHQDASDCIAALPGWIEAEIKKAKGAGK